MQIHKGLLTHDGVVGATAGKVLDLGFNGQLQDLVNVGIQASAIGGE